MAMVTTGIAALRHHFYLGFRTYTIAVKTVYTVSACIELSQAGRPKVLHKI